MPDRAGVHDPGIQAAQSQQAADGRVDEAHGIGTEALLERRAARVRSPGDLDEAVSALLTTADHRKGSNTGSGADRVAAYREGFMNGASACTG